MSARRGFTLVELLVVIVIIGILVGLTMPAILAARESGRQTKCVNNQQQIYKAIAQYEIDKNHYPGCLNPALGSGAGTRKVNWVMAILPYIGRSDLWTGPESQVATGWRYGNGTQVQLPILICPNDQPTGANATVWLSYVVNGNVFKDRSAANVGTTADVSVTQIKSPQQTIMLGERYDPKVTPSVTGPWTEQTTATKLTFTMGAAGAVGAGTALAPPPPPQGTFSCQHAGTIIVTFFAGNTEKLSDAVLGSDYYCGP